MRSSGVLIATVSAVLLGMFGTATPAGSTAPTGPAQQASTATLAVDNQAATSAAALAANGTGGSAVFYRVRSGEVFMRTFQNGTWSAPTTVGGRIVGAPAAVLAGTTLVVAGRGTDSALWVRTRAGSTWSGWRSLGGILSAAPALAGWSDGRVDAFVRATDDSIRTKTYRSATGWASAYTNLGGPLSTGPAAVASASGRISVFAGAADHRILVKSLTSTGWGSWTSLNGLTYTAPAAIWDAVRAQTLVFVRGANDQLYRGSRTATSWSGWVPMGGVLVDGPGAGAPATGQADVVLRATDASLRTRSYRDGAWSTSHLTWTPTPLPPPPASRLGVDWTRIPTTAKVVALTFDAGANAAGLPSIRATLARKNVPATMFLTGDWVRSFPALANQVTVTGFMVGNHSNTHPDFTPLTDAQVTAEVTTAATAIFRANGADPKPAFRFPFGAVDSRVLADVNQLGYVAVRWTVDTLGWQGTSGGMTTAKVIDRVMAGLQPGEIVLMHLGSNPTDGTTLDASALPTIIDQVRARGYQFVTLQSLTG